MCYYVKTLYFNDPLFKETDATYILYLEGNGRYKQIEEQLKEYHPTKIVHIIFNKGYKKCDKPAINKPPLDLIDAYKYAMNHAKRYNTILILEDDFMFNKIVKEPKHRNNVDKFVSSHKDTKFIYRIGCIPFVQIPYNMHNYIGIGIGSHSVIYSKKVREIILKDTPNDWDIYLSTNHINYIYYTPLCYQLYPNTENQTYWGKDNIFFYIMAKMIILILKMFKLDKQPEPGYSIFYAFSKIWLWILILLILFLLK
jgi:hypothetical protein